jgi:enamine deaminase RidA (YjgF/YER057c/UK114 family)
LYIASPVRSFVVHLHTTGETMNHRVNISSGAKWEDIVGYSRAVRIGAIVEVAGTVATGEQGEIVGIDDPYEQTRFIFSRIEHALQKAGGSLKDVVRTRMFVTDITRWQEIGRAHGEFFREIRPASTMVQVAALIAPGLFVEIEATAVITDHAQPS